MNTTVLHKTYYQQPSHVLKSDNQSKGVYGYLLKLFHDVVRFMTAKEDNFLMKDSLANYIAHTKEEIDKAKVAYCEAVIDIAKSRTEAEYQITRYREMRKALELIEGCHCKTPEDLKKELADYIGGSVD